MIVLPTINKTPPIASSLSLCKAQGVTDYVYIGRKVARGNQVMDGSLWGNPFIVGRHGNAAECLAKYEIHIRQNDYLVSQIPTLAGKHLACWCKTKKNPDAPCHGDVLVKLFQEWGNAPNNPVNPDATYIWSDEHKALWRPKGQGYTVDLLQAGTWTLTEASKAIQGAGPEKRLRVCRFIAGTALFASQMRDNERAFPMYPHGWLIYIEY